MAWVVQAIAPDPRTVVLFGANFSGRCRTCGGERNSPSCLARSSGLVVLQFRGVVAFFFKKKIGVLVVCNANGQLQGNTCISGVK
jgi:hypothetical protein